ncbi:MAG TPA: CBS domain-containing protein [Candidatus Bathyarchaeia archaeon]|nr:CBS domain-containing protein [Candidatus Bathyarchaeia archaeon]
MQDPWREDRLEQIMTGNVIKIASDATLYDAHKLMSEAQLSRLAVTSANGKLHGMITQRDIVRFLGRDKSERALEEIIVKEIMSTPAIELKPSNTLADAASAMNKKGISSVVIIGENEEVLGIVTKTDICYHFSQEYSKLRVEDVMTRKVFTVRPTHSIFFVASLLARQGISRVPVVDDETLRGIITLVDIAGSAVVMRPELLEGSDELCRTVSTAKLRAMTASDIMKPNPITVRTEEPLTKAAKLMIEHRISGIPAVDSKKILHGIVTKTDIVRAIMQ